MLRPIPALQARARRWSVLIPLVAVALTTIAPLAAAQTESDTTEVPARPMVVADLVDLLARRAPSLWVLAQVRKNCLATALNANDERQLYAAGADSSYVSALRTSCVAANLTAATVVDSTGGMVTPSVLAMQRTCERGSPAACDSVADKYLEGIFAPKSPTKAAEYLLMACTTGHTPACWRAVEILDASPNPVDNTQGAAVLTLRCDQGEMIACRRLGRFYLDGHGLPKDGARALALYRRACDADEPLACVDAATMLLEAKGIPADTATGYAYTARACEVGGTEQSAAQCARAGAAYAAGKHVGADHARAATLYSRGCDANDPRACG